MPESTTGMRREGEEESQSDATSASTSVKRPRSTARRPCGLSRRSATLPSASRAQARRLVVPQSATIQSIDATFSAPDTAVSLLCRRPTCESPQAAIIGRALGAEATTRALWRSMDFAFGIQFRMKSWTLTSVADAKSVGNWKLTRWSDLHEAPPRIVASGMSVRPS